MKSTGYHPPTNIQSHFIRNPTLLALAISSAFVAQAQASVGHTESLFHSSLQSQIHVEANSPSFLSSNRFFTRISGTFTSPTPKEVINASNGQYFTRLDESSEIGTDAIEISDITFRINDDSLTGASNGALGIFDRDLSNNPLKSISIKNIEQTTDTPNYYSLYGVNYNNSSSNTPKTLKTEEIIINQIKSVSTGGSASGIRVLNANVNYGTINISDIKGGPEGLGVGLWVESSNNIYELSSVDPNSENSGIINISNVIGGDATGADFDMSASGKQLTVYSINANRDPEDLWGYGGQATGVIFSEGTVKFDEISVSQVFSEKGSALGLHIAGEVDDFYTDSLNISHVTGNSSTGLNFNYSKDNNVVKTNQVVIENIGKAEKDNEASTSKESIGVDVARRKWEGNILSITGIHASDDGIATGIKNYSEGNASGEVNQNVVSVTDVSGGSAFGINNSVTIPHPVSIPHANFFADTASVTEVSGDKCAYGVYNAQNAHFHVGSLTLENVNAVSGTAIALAAEDNADVQVGNALINPGKWTTYEGNYAGAPSAEVNTESTFAIRTVDDANVTMATGENQTAQIYGTILANRGNTATEVVGGTVKIGNNTGTVGIYGDVYAGNGGSVELTLGKGSVLEGQVDDYHELDSTLTGIVFRNSNFGDLPVTKAGSTTIKLNGGTWLARGQSFVKNVDFGTNGGLVDLTKNANSSVSIENLSGRGQFDMNFGAYTEGNESVESDMLYIQNVAAGSSFTIQAHLADGVTVNDLARLRFATVGNVEGGHSGNLFKIQIADEGFNNWNFNVATEDYAVGDEDNARFNGIADGKGDYKPGENAVDAIYGNNGASTLAEGQASQNYYIASAQEGASVSDAGQAVIATARGLYYNAVEIDRFNQRYGDRRYDETNNSVWVRVRHDRWGTDAGIGDFDSQNTTYQMGYDYTQPVDGGKMIYGAAFDFMDGDTDYKSIHGSGETKRYALSAYATYMGENGSYLDVIGKVGRLSNEYSVRLDSGNGVSADYHNWMTAVSVETGHQLSSDASRWFVEPQIQAQYVHVSSNDYTNGQTKIDQDSIHSFITRAGFRVGRWLDDEKNANAYFKADVLREWAGEQDIHVKDKTTAAGGDTFEISNHGTWFDVGMGFQAPFGKNFYAYGDAEYRFGNDLDQTWTFNFGGKFVF